MSFIDFIQSLQPKRLSDFLFNLAFLLSPGYAVMFFLNSELFFNLDLFKLTILSIAAISPLILLNFLASVQKESITSNQAHRGTLRLSILVSNLVIYISLFITFFIGHQARWFLVVAAIIETLTFICLWFLTKKPALIST